MLAQGLLDAPDGNGASDAPVDRERIPQSVGGLAGVGVAEVAKFAKHYVRRDG